MDTISCTTNARRGRNINRSSLADSVGNFYVLNLVQNLLQPKTDTFYTELGLLGIDYRQSLLIRNPRIDSVFYYLTLQHNNNNGGFNKSFGVYLSTFSDSLGTIKTLVRNQFLDSLSGLIYKPFGSNGFFNNYSIYSFPHCNGRDLWIGFYHLVKKRFYTYLISDTGVTATPVISPSFSQIDFMIDLAVSPSSNAIVVKAIDAKSTTYFDRIHNAFVPDSSEVRLLTIQFDNTTGSFNSPTSFYSNKIHAYYNYVKNLFGNSMAFSPNGQFLYHLNVGLDYTTHNGGTAGVAYYPKTHHIEQYEATGNSFGNKDTLAVIPHFNGKNTQSILPDDIALAPDGKIYIAFDSGYNVVFNAKLGLIALPNKKGAACRLHLPLKTDTIGLDKLYFPRLPLSSVTETYFFTKNTCAKDTTFLWVNDSTCLDSLFWDFGDPSSGALNTAKGFSVAHQYNQGGTYNLKLYRFGQGFTDTLHKKIKIEGRDTVHTRSDTLLCNGDTINVGQNLGYDYNFLWSNRGLDSSTIVHDSGWVWVEAFNNCITTRDSFYVSYASTPEVNLGNDTSACDTVLLPSTTWPLSSYRWSTSDTTPFLGVNKTGTYQLTSTNICGSDSDEVRVYIHKNAQTHIPVTTICRSTRFVVSVPMPFTKYRWDGATRGHTRTIYGPGTYWLRTTNLCGNFLDTFVVTGILAPAVDLGKDTTICAQHPLLLNAGANDTALTWLWRHNGSTDSTAVAQTTGAYSVAVTDQCGTVNDSVRIRVLQPPNLLINDTSICSNDSVLVTATADSASFRWSTGASTNSIWVKEYKTYGVGASNRCGTDSIVFKLSELLPPTLAFPADTTLCNDTIWLLDAAQPRSTYLWKSGSNQSQKSISTEGLYAVTVTNVFGRTDKAVSVTYQKTPLAAIAVSPTGKYCPGTPLTLTGSSLTQEGTYFWNTEESTNSIVVTEQDITPLL